MRVSEGEELNGRKEQIRLGDGHRGDELVDCRIFGHGDGQLAVKLGIPAAFPVGELPIPLRDVLGAQARHYAMTRFALTSPPLKTAGS